MNKVLSAIIFIGIILNIGACSNNEQNPNEHIVPSITIDSPGNRSTVSGILTLSGTYTGDADTIKGNIDSHEFGVNINNGNWSASIDTTEKNGADPLFNNGTYFISIRIKSNSENSEYITKSITIIINNDNSYDPPQGSHITGSITLTGGLTGSISVNSPLYIKATEMNSKKEFISDPITSGSFPYEFNNIMNLSAGTYIISAILDTDNNGPDLDKDPSGSNNGLTTIDDNSGTVIIGLSIILENPMKRQFWVIDHQFTDYKTNSNAWYKILTEKKAENDHVIVYVDVDKPGITEEIAETLAREFSNTIYPTVTQNFAAPYDFDENGKTILTVYDIRDAYFTTYTGFIGGYFFGTDLYSEESVDDYNDKNGASLHTNEGDILYIDCNPADIISSDTWRTISHEFQHMVNASYYMRHKPSSNSTSTWLDEGLAEAANHMCYGVVEKRIEYYNFVLDDYLQNGHPLYYWSTNMMPNYSLSYLFFQYLKFQSDAGDGIFKKIVQSQYGDYRAVMDAIADDANLSGLSWGSSTEEQLNRVLLRWYATNAGVSNDDKYRYSSEISSLTNPPVMKLYSGSGVTLQSGGGIVKSMNGDFNNPVSGYAYLSVDTDGTDEDLTVDGDGKYANRDLFVAVNTVYNSNAHSGVYSSLPLNTLYPEDEAYSKKTSPFIYAEPQQIDFNMPPDIMEKLREHEKELQQN